MKSKGFISTSIIYSFFLVFLMVSTLLLSNFIQNRTLINDITDDIKNSIYRITPSITHIEASNLALNGNFESTTVDSYINIVKLEAGMNHLTNEEFINEIGTTREEVKSELETGLAAINKSLDDINENFSSNFAYSGTNSYEMSISNTTEILRLMMFPLNLDLYYFQMKVLVTGDSTASSSSISITDQNTIYNPLFGGAFGSDIYEDNVFSVIAGESDAYLEKTSTIPDIDSSKYGEWQTVSGFVFPQGDQMLIEIEETNKSGSATYIDDIVVIALDNKTMASILDTNEYSIDISDYLKLQEILDKNISYFEGTKNIIIKN